MNEEIVTSVEEPISEDITVTEDNLTNVDSSPDSVPLSEGDPISNISSSDIVDALTVIVNENLSTNTEAVVEDPVPIEPIDYTEKLISIDTELANIRELLQSEQVSEARTIFEKPLNEFTVEEGIGTLGVVIVICAVVIAFVNHFSFSLWK